MSQKFKRYITIKERIGAMKNTLPFEQLHHHMIVELAHNTVFWLNCIPHMNSIHAKLSP